MYIYTSSQAKPYVYICVHNVTSKFYIGYREKNVKLNLTSNVDFPLYRTSSKTVRPNFNEYDWYIVAEFNTSEDAYDFEQQLIFENWDNPLLINSNCHYNKRRFKSVVGSNKGKIAWNKGVAQTDAQRAVNSLSHAGQGKGIKKGPFNVTHKHNLSIARKKVIRPLHSEETKEKMRKPKPPRTATHTENAKLAAQKIAKQQCPHCGALCSPGNLVRWHLDNCKTLLQ